ncbi:hypothetical protein ACN9MZ_06770 [Pseudoduganella sp. S-14]|uniref:hypothetical protein n=1 Tax=Pseudoduganella sp. S-14 TaxID=3404065 RepID=UPI003CEA5BD3
MGKLKDDILSGDATRVWSSACAIIKLRDSAELDALASILDEITASTKKLSLGGVVFPNDKHLQFALRKLRFHRGREGCLCRLYPEYLMFDPNQEQAAGNVRIEGITYLEGNWVDFYQCSCATCGTAFKVEEREYHYTWWGWRLSQ